MKYAEAGKYPVCLTVSNANGSDTYCRDLFIGITGQQDVEAAEPDWWIAPNPARDVARVVFRRGVELSAGWIAVTDTYGRSVYGRPVAHAGGGADLVVRDWPAGLYFVTLEGAPGARKTCRLVVAP